LLPDLRCALYGDPRRPKVCASLRPAPALCGRSAAEARATLTRLEVLTRPSACRVPDGHGPDPGAVPRDAG
jgi:hypothetical protein